MSKSQREAQDSKAQGVGRRWSRSRDLEKLGHGLEILIWADSG
jgi:hypothetical protein